MMTSRRWLSTLDSVMHLDVGRLSQAEAIELLDRVTDDRRVSADPELAAEIVTRCDHLPLAVRIAGARLAARRNLALRDLAARLRNDRHRLDELAQDDLAVRTCFDGGYRELATRDPEAATMFRRLGLLAVATVSTYVAAALIDRPLRPAAATLDRLVEARLVEPIAPRHYRMHDLLRLFAVERAAEETTGTREAALRRALSCYLIAARAVGSEYRPNSIGDSSHEFVVHFPEPVPITGPAGAMEWLDEEIANLIAAARQTAAEPGPLNPFAVHLDTAIGDLLVGLGRWRETEAVSGAAVAAAQQSGDRAAQAFALVSVGSAYVQSGRIPAGIATLERAVALSVADGDARGEANCQDHLGWAYFTAGDFLRARDCVARGLELRMRAGNVTGEAISHNNLADILIVLGQPSDALPHLEASVLIHRNNGDRVGAAIARSNVGRCLLLLGRNVEAVPVLDEAAEVFHESENVREEWRAILTRAVARRRTGAPELARRDCERALDLCRSAQDAYGEATCLDQLGIAVQHCGDDRLGTEHRRRAAALRAGTDISPDHSLEAVLAL